MDREWIKLSVPTKLLIMIPATFTLLTELVGLQLNAPFSLGHLLHLAVVHFSSSGGRWPVSRWPLLY